MPTRVLPASYQAAFQRFEGGGVWLHEITPPAELRRLFGTAIDGASDVEVPGMEAAANHKYSRNILVDFKDEESPLRPETAEIMRQRAASTNHVPSRIRRSHRQPASVRSGAGPSGTSKQD
jgi:hypothetical protein